MNEETKEFVRRQLWTMVLKIQDILRPPELVGSPFQCKADGSPTTSPLLEDLDPDSPQPLISDSDVRDRIYQCYLYFRVRLHKDQLLDMPPQAGRSVFTHDNTALAILWWMKRALLRGSLIRRGGVGIQIIGSTRR